MTTEKYSRQSFLGERSEETLKSVGVGIVGLGGGGSHIVQQLAHVGVEHFVLYDPDAIEESNLNRLVGATAADVLARRPKIEIAARVISAVNPRADVRAYATRWQLESEPLRGCSLIFGGVDGFRERRELETTARRFLVPYVDIGLDVHQVGDEAPQMAGHVILSMPGGPCMECLGYLSASKIDAEAAAYGAAGPRPQVVWANGVLASMAVGVAIDLLTDWTQALRQPVYLSYEENRRVVGPNPRLQFKNLDAECPHFPNHDVGEPTFTKL